MGKKKKPSYASTTFDTGDLFGSATTNKQGTTYTPASWMSNTMGTVGNNLNSTLSNMLSGDFSNDANYQAYQNNLNRQMSNAFDTDVLSQLSNKGLMRSSGLQAATNAFADTLANNQMNLYDSYYNRQANNLSNLLNTSNALYNYLAGLTTGSRSDTSNLNNFNLANVTDNSGLFGSLANAAGNLGGSIGSALIKNKGGS